MGFNLAIEEKDYSNEDQTWLGKAHGTDSNDSGTLDADKFLAAFPSGIVPSGVVVRRINASGLYALFADAAADGLTYHLFTTTDLKGITAATAKDQVVSLFWHGQVIESKLPTGHGLTAAAKAQLPHVRYV